MTHIAGISADDILHGNPKGNVIHSGIMVLDTQDLRHVLQRHKVKALLQGHRHMNENYLYRGVWYLSSDAVSACWWSGTWRGHDYGYTALQAMPDGRLAWEHRKFIWETYLEPEDTLERQRTKERQEFEAEQARLAREERGEA